MDEKDDLIFYEYLKNCKDNCYCNMTTKCDNCIAKEHLQELYRRINKI